MKRIQSTPNAPCAPSKSSKESILPMGVLSLPQLNSRHSHIFAARLGPSIAMSIAARASIHFGRPVCSEPIGLCIDGRISSRLAGAEPASPSLLLRPVGNSDECMYQDIAMHSSLARSMQIEGSDNAACGLPCNSKPVSVMRDPDQKSQTKITSMDEDLLCHGIVLKLCGNGLQ
jgi:hypothetical protein